MSSRVAYRYAKALFDLANERGAFKEVMNDVATLRNAIGGSRELEMILRSPVVDDRKKKLALETIFKGKVGEMVMGFIGLLTVKGRSSDLPPMLDAYQELVDRQMNVAAATITTAIELGETQRTQIVEAIQNLSGSAIRPTFEVDPEVIGGFRARFQDRMIDATVRHQLDRLRETLGAATN